VPPDGMAHKQYNKLVSLDTPYLWLDTKTSEHNPFHKGKTQYYQGGSISKNIILASSLMIFMKLKVCRGNIFPQINPFKCIAGFDARKFEAYIGHIRAPQECASS